MKKSNLFLIVALLLSLNVSSQENLMYEKNLSSYKDYFNEEFGVDFTIPKNFKNLNKYYVIWKVSNDGAKHSGSMLGPMFLSKDKGCILAFPALLMDSVSWNHKSSQKRFNISSKNQITDEIKTSLGLYYSYRHPLNNDSVKFDFYDYVTLVVGERSHEMFNADSVYIYDLPNADSGYFFDESLEKTRKEKYPYCTGMFITKHDRVTIYVKLFFTEKGRKKRCEYIKMLSNKIWYLDNFEYD